MNRYLSEHPPRCRPTGITHEHWTKSGVFYPCGMLNWMLNWMIKRFFRSAFFKRTQREPAFWGTSISFAGTFWDIIQTCQMIRIAQSVNRQHPWGELIKKLRRLYGDKNGDIQLIEVVKAKNATPWTIVVQSSGTNESSEAVVLGVRTHRHWLMYNATANRPKRWHESSLVAFQIESRCFQSKFDLRFDLLIPMQRSCVKLSYAQVKWPCFIILTIWWQMRDLLDHYQYPKHRRPFIVEFSTLPRSLNLNGRFPPCQIHTQSAEVVLDGWSHFDHV